MAAPAFLTCFPMYCPHSPALASEKNRKTLSRMLQPKKPSNAIVPQKKRHGFKT